MSREEEQSLLEALLFEREVSRNRNFEQFEAPEARRVHKVARWLRAIHRELQQPEVQYWTEPTDGGDIYLHLHRPHLGAKRLVLLSPLHWQMLNHPRWDVAG